MKSKNCSASFWLIDERISVENNGSDENRFDLFLEHWYHIISLIMLVFLKTRYKVIVGYLSLRYLILYINSSVNFIIRPTKLVAQRQFPWKKNLIVASNITHTI